MKKSLRTVLLVLGFAISFPAAPATTAGDYDCGEWFKSGNFAKAWLLGYLRHRVKIS